MLVVKHEAQIDWSRHRIESAEALDSFLREVMLPSLRDWITPDHPKSHYCKSLHLERMLANPAPHIDEARQIRQREGTEAARRFLLGHINQHKKEHFEGWWRYLMEENPLYAKHPAFQYLVLRPVFEGSTAKDTRTPLPVDAEALAHLFERIQQGRVAPGTKLLRLLSEITAFGAAALADEPRPAFGSDCCWVVIKKDDVNAANRVAALCRGSGWCVVSSNMAAHYLRSSDFHLLLEGGRAKVALRFSGNKAVEVQGQGNGDPGPWWPRILLYCAARGAQMTHRQDAARQQDQRIRQELGATQRRAKQLGDLLKAQPAKVHLLAMAEEWDDASRLVMKDAWLACLRADPLCGGLLPDWMENDPAVKETTLEAWVALVGSDPLSYAAIPGTLAQDPRIQAALKIGWMALLKRDVTQWNQCPEFLQHEFPQDGEFIHTFRIEWLDLLKRDATHWNQCPEFLQQEETVIRAHKTGWIELLKLDVTHWNKCPKFIQEEFRQWADFMQSLKERWIQLVDKNAHFWDRCPDFLQQDGDVIRQGKLAWGRLLEREIVKWRECPEFLKQEISADLEFFQAFEKRWFEFLDVDVTLWKHAPESVKETLSGNAQFMQAFKTRWTNLLERDVTFWEGCPKFLQQEEMLRLARKTGWLVRIKRNLCRWNECPESLQQEFQQNTDFVVIFRDAWADLLMRDVTQWDHCPVFLLENEAIIDAYQTGWRILAKSDVTKWHLCPEHLKEEFIRSADFIKSFKADWISRICFLGQRGPVYLNDHWAQCPDFLRDDPEVIQAVKNRWFKILRLDPESWDICPALLQRDEVVIEVLKTSWLTRLAKAPQKWRRCPEFLKQDPVLIGCLKAEWGKLLMDDATQWKKLPRVLASDATIVLALNKGWRRLLKKSPGLWKKCPAHLRMEFQRDEVMSQKLVRVWIDWLARHKEAWADCPDFLKENPLVFQAYRNSWIQYLSTDVNVLEQCPDQLKDAEMQGMLSAFRAQARQNTAADLQRQADKGKTALKQATSAKREGSDHWINLLVESPQAWKNCPETLRADRKVVFALINGWLRLLEANPWQLANIPYTMQGNAQLLRAVKKGWAALHVSGSWRWKNCPQSLRSDDEFIEIKKEAWIQKLEDMAAPSRVVMLHQLLKDKVLVEEDLPSSWQTEKSVLSPILSPLEWVRRKPWIIDDRLEEIRHSIEEDGSEKRIREERLKYWKNEIKKDWRRWNITPASLRNDECLLVVMRKVLGPEIRRDPSLWNRLPECYRDDKCLQRVHGYATRDRQGNYENIKPARSDAS